MLARYEPETWATVEPPEGAIILCGPANACFDLMGVHKFETVTHLILRPRDPHSVPFGTKVVRLPQPDSRWGQQ